MTSTISGVVIKVPLFIMFLSASRNLGPIQASGPPSKGLAIQPRGSAFSLRRALERLRYFLHQKRYQRAHLGILPGDCDAFGVQ